MVAENHLFDIEGNSTSLKPWQGKLLLIVNVASRCGFTPFLTPLRPPATMRPTIF